VSGFGRLDWVGVGGLLTGLLHFFINRFPGLWLGFEEENLCTTEKLAFPPCMSMTDPVDREHRSHGLVVLPGNMSFDQKPRGISYIKHHFTFESSFHVDFMSLVYKISHYRWQMSPDCSLLRLHPVKKQPSPFLKHSPSCLHTSES
jgi:hypothetical protein